MNHFLSFLSKVLFCLGASFATAWSQCPMPASIATAPSPNAATITWNASPNAVGYELRYRILGARVAPTYVTATNNSVVLSGLSSNICYEFTVRTDCGNGSFSAWATVQNFCVPGGSGVFCGLPTNVSSSSTAQAATLNWDAVNNAAGYEFRYRIVGSGVTPTYVNVSTNSIHLANLLPSTCYEYALRTQCGPNNYSSSTQVYQFCTPAFSTPCPLPTRVTDYPFTNGSTLIWPSVSGAVGYQLRYRLVGASGPPTYQYTTATNLTISGLQTNVCYEFTMRTHCGGHHYGSWSRPQPFCIPATTGYCAAPHSFRNAPSNTSATLDWSDAPSNANTVGYEIRYRLGGTYAPLSYASTSTPYAILSGLTPNTCYDYAVRKNCSGGNYSPWSPAQSFCTTTAPTCDSVRFRGTYHGYSVTQFRVDTMPNIPEYEVRWRLTALNTPYQIERLSASEFLAVDSFLLDTCYDYSLRTHCGSGNFGPWMADETFCTFPCDTPGPLIRTYPNQGTTLGNWWASTQLNFQPYPYVYQDVYQQLRYRLAYSNDPYHHTYFFDVLHGPVLTELDPNTCYEVSVRNRCGQSDSSAWSTPIYPCTDSLPLRNCDAPTNIQAFPTTDTANASSRVLVTWNPATNANYQSIRYRILGTTPYTTSRLFADSSAVLLGLLPNTCYEYRVNSWCPAGFGFYSSLDTFCTPSLLPAPSNAPMTSPLYSKALHSNSFTCQVFPNPTQGQCSVVFSRALDPANYTIQVFNLLGQEMVPQQLERRAEGCHVDLSTLEQGIYFIKITTPELGKTVAVQVIP